MHGRAHRPHIAQIFKDAVAQPLQRLHTVAVLQRRLGWYMQPVVWPEVLVVLIGWHDVLHASVFPHQHACLVRPAPGHILDLVATATQDQQGHAKGRHELVASCVALDAEVEYAQLVLRQAVCAALEHNGAWLVVLHDLGDDGIKQELVGCIIHAIPQGHVDGVVLASTNANVRGVPSAREKGIAMLVERHCHYAVSGEEGLLHTIPMVHIDVHIQHSVVVLEEL
mmetsp:Transcript_23830/g.65484  ORF Transcript_23830/g.65484 Transcript_23830/m.65484 type:complete len:225 (-) Transcript_23830:672-1346(-)